MENLREEESDAVTPFIRDRQHMEMGRGSPRSPPPVCWYTTARQEHNRRRLSGSDLEPEPERVYMAEVWPRLNFP
jgi:hypothetical protein